MATLERDSAAKVTALILAGEDNASPSPLSFSERVVQKALVEVGSRPMIEWALDAARNSPRTGDIVVVGFDAPHYDLGADVLLVEGAGDFASSLLAGLRAIVQNSDGNHPVLVMGCDAPLIIPEALTWFVDACGDRALDLYLAVVRQETFAAIYPQAKRTWFKTREGRFGSSDLALVRPAALLNNVALTRQLAAHRRDPAALRKALPASLALRAWTGSLSLPEVRDIVQHLVGLQIGIVELPFATVAMDVDTLEDLAAVRYEMAQQRMMRAA